MFDFAKLPISPDNARAARNYLGFSQSRAAEESGLQSHKIKRFEAGNYIPDEAFLHDLRAFFEGRGYEFQDTQKPGAKAKQTGQVFPAGVVGETAENQGAPRVPGPQRTSFHHMRIAITDDREMGELLDMIEVNEERVNELLGKPVKTDFFGGLTDDTCAGHAQAVSLLAENGAMFARLFGRELGGKPADAVLDGSQKPSTRAELLHRAHAEMHRAAAGDRIAKGRKKAETAPTSILEAIGLT